MKSSKLSSVLIRSLALGAVAGALLSWSSVAEAGDCKQVTFHFHNSAGSKIKVKAVEIAGNDGTWSEDINNHELPTNAHYTTDPRTLNKLDSGQTPSSMTVKYDKWDGANGQWLNNKEQKFTDRKRCDDGVTYNFDVK
jgi:hypothetical protein